MSKPIIKKKSSNFHIKRELRIQALKEVKGNVKILDCFHGNGELWKSIMKVGLEFDLLGIDINPSLSPFETIQGDNIEVVKSLDIEKYNIVDLDAYTNPIPLLKYLYPRAKDGTVFIYTLILVRFAYTNNDLVEESGGKNIRSKSRTILNRSYGEMWSSLLYKLGVTKFKEISPPAPLLKKYGYFVKEDQKNEAQN